MPMFPGALTITGGQKLRTIRQKLGRLLRHRAGVNAAAKSALVGPDGLDPWERLKMLHSLELPTACGARMLEPEYPTFLVLVLGDLRTDSKI
eukprot:7092057-Pyramimonas_sp.AAC.1